MAYAGVIFHSFVNQQCNYLSLIKRNNTMKRKIRMGMVGGGQGSFIGPFIVSPLI